MSKKYSRVASASESEIEPIVPIGLMVYSPRVQRGRPSDRVRQRLRDELETRDISQRELADALSRSTGEFWSHGRIAKVLTGRVQLLVDDADAIAKIVGISLVEAVRDRGMEFCADMTPTELRILERLRRRRELFDGVRILLDVPPDTQSTVLPKLAPKPKRGRPLNSDAAKRNV